ncbi:MAG: succinylglutamate desuccinylase [Betaproteobacteria bacterium]|nr:succinylglutamate desuccinylase [Betaproteobacteria bacterium]
MAIGDDRWAGLQFKSVSYAGLEPGTRLIVLGAVHGNEVCGRQAIERVIAEIEAGRIVIRRGRLTLVPVTNPLAHRENQRSGDRNLNRNLRPTDSPVDFEDHVANWLCPLLAGHEVLLDLHSFHTAGQPFAALGPENNTGTVEPFAQAAREEALARRLGVSRFMDGWLDTYARGVARRVRAPGATPGRATLLNTDPRYGVGTTEYMRAIGGCSITLECGQHADPSAPEVAYRAILNALAHLELADLPRPAPLAVSEALRLHEVVDKSDDGDVFARDWSSFDRLKRGDHIGTRKDGTRVVAEQDGYIVFPNPPAQAGQEWFYLAKASPRNWLPDPAEAD